MLSKTFWLVSNIVNSLIAPKMPVNQDKDFLKKRTYGKTPVYMQKIKGEIEEEYKLVREMQLEEEAQRDQ